MARAGAGLGTAVGPDGSERRSATAVPQPWPIEIWNFKIKNRFVRNGPKTIRNDPKTVRKRSGTVRKRSDTVRNCPKTIRNRPKPSKTVRKRSEIDPKSSETVGKRSFLIQVYQPKFFWYLNFENEHRNLLDEALNTFFQNSIFHSASGPNR